MSAALADLLIELADPPKLRLFRADPEAAMTAAGLTEADKVALRSRKSGWIRYQALKGVEDPSDLLEKGDEVTAGPALDVIDVITATDVVVVI